MANKKKHNLSRKPRNYVTLSMLLFPRNAGPHQSSNKKREVSRKTCRQAVSHNDQ